jgi:FkbM family methyltransferase
VIGKGYKNLYIRFISQCVWILERLIFYPKLRKVLSGLKEPNESEVILDVGANRGQSAKFFKSIFPSVNIFCFEPVDSIFRILYKSNLDKVIAIHCAISAADGHRIFYQSVFDEASTFKLPKSNSSWNSFKSKLLLVKKEEMYRPVNVRTRSLDSISNEMSIKSIFLLKIDVEGHEFEVLQGANSLLRNGLVKIIQLERHMSDLRDDSGPQIEEFLRVFGFTKYRSIKHSIGNFFEEIYVLNAIINNP